MFPVATLPIAMFRRLLATGILAVLLAAGCSSDRNGSSLTSPSMANGSTTVLSATATTAPIDSDAATIPADVLGSAWSDEGATLSATDADSALSRSCPAIARRRARYDVVRRARVALTRSRRPLPAISDDLTIFTDRNAAADVFNAYVGKGMLRCFPTVVTDSGLVLGGVRTQRVPVREVGDAAAAIQLRGTSVAGGLASQVIVEMIVVQHDQALHIIIATWSDLFPLSAAQRRAIVQAAGA